MSSVFTIGHSNHSAEKFIELLRIHEISSVADVRSSPYSKFNPQFNRERLKSFLHKHKIYYVFLGKELGARSDNPECYIDNKVQYGLLAKTSLFQSGLDRIIKGYQKHKICLMCSEKDPLDCHRAILVSRELIKRGVKVFHILSNGNIETYEDTAKRLRSIHDLGEPELFSTEEELENKAYKEQENQIAYIK